MALSIPLIKNLIKTEKELILGPPADPVSADAGYLVEATIFFKLLTTLATVSVDGGGVDSNGDTLVSPTGKIV